MKYNFDEAKIVSPIGVESSFPTFNLDNSLQYGDYFNSEITHLGRNLDYVKEIVGKLEAVLNEDLDFYEGFGFECYMIECDKLNAKVINVCENEKTDAIIPTQEVYELMRDWRNYLIKYYNSKQKINTQGEIKKSTGNLSQVLSSHLYKKEKNELIYTGYDLGYRDSIIEKFMVSSNLKKVVINEFNSGIKQRLNNFSFGHKNWIFIPEVFHYYLYNLDNGETFNQTVWFRENKQNHKDSNVGNYFANKIHFSINRKSCVIFDLTKKVKQVIKPKELLGDIYWAYILNSKIIRFFFNFQNKTALYNLESNEFYNIEPIITSIKNIKLLHTKSYEVKEGKHITNFIIVKHELENEYFDFIEKTNNEQKI